MRIYFGTLWRLFELDLILKEILPNQILGQILLLCCYVVIALDGYCNMLFCDRNLIEKNVPFVFIYLLEEIFQFYLVLGYMG